MKLLTLTTALLFSLPGFVLAGEAVDKSLKASADGKVEINNVRGTIKVVGWNKNKVHIKGELDDQAEELVFETQGQVTVIDIKMPRNTKHEGKGSDLVIKIPKNNRLDFSGVSTDISAESISGGVAIRSVSGEIKLSNTEEQLSVKSVSGDIVMKDTSGEAKLASVSGNISGNHESRELEAKTVSGNLNLELGEYDSLAAKSINGEIRVSGQMRDSGSTNLGTVNGDIRLVLNNTVNARARVKAGPGGKITNELSSDKVEEIFPNQQKLVMTLGDGSGDIKVGTINGSITLKANN